MPYAPLFSLKTHTCTPIHNLHTCLMSLYFPLRHTHTQPPYMPEVPQLSLKTHKHAHTPTQPPSVPDPPLFPLKTHKHAHKQAHTHPPLPKTHVPLRPHAHPAGRRTGPRTKRTRDTAQVVRKGEEMPRQFIYNGCIQKQTARATARPAPSPLPPAAGSGVARREEKPGPGCRAQLRKRPVVSTPFAQSMPYPDVGEIKTSLASESEMKRCLGSSWVRSGAGCPVSPSAWVAAGWMPPASLPALSGMGPLTWVCLAGLSRMGLGAQELS